MRISTYSEKKQLTEEQRHAVLRKFSPLQHEIIRQYSRGAQLKQCAKALSLPAVKVQTKLRAIKEHLGANTAAEVVAVACRAGFLSEE